MNQLQSLLIKVVLPVFLVGLYFLFVLDLKFEFLGNLILFSAGLVLGLFILWFDEKWMHSYYEDRPGHFLTRSLLFLLIYPVVGVFVATSSGSSLGQGLILGLGISILAEMYQFKKSVPAFSERFLWQLKKTVNSQDISRIFLLAIAVFLILTYLVIL